MCHYGSSSREYTGTPFNISRPLCCTPLNRTTAFALHLPRVQTTCPQHKLSHLVPCPPKHPPDTELGLGADITTTTITTGGPAEKIHITRTGGGGGTRGGEETEDQAGGAMTLTMIGKRRNAREDQAGVVST